uniref:Uncharacterized protein n=1 Tax=Triticum urartu TaxID=4572 RepID=A0A8R7QRX7_TRIUA
MAWHGMAQLDRPSNGVLLAYIQYCSINVQASSFSRPNFPLRKTSSLIQLKQAAAFPFQGLRKRNPRRDKGKLLAPGRLMAGGGWPAGDDEAVRRGGNGRDGGCRRGGAAWREHEAGGEGVAVVEAGRVRVRVGVAEAALVEVARVAQRVVLAPPERPGRRRRRRRRRRPGRAQRLPPLPPQPPDETPEPAPAAAAPPCRGADDAASAAAAPAGRRSPRAAAAFHHGRCPRLSPSRSSPPRGGACAAVCPVQCGAVWLWLWDLCR